MDKSVFYVSTKERQRAMNFKNYYQVYKLFYNVRTLSATTIPIGILCKFYEIDRKLFEENLYEAV